MCTQSQTFAALKYGTFTARSFGDAYKSEDFSAFAQLPAEVRKQFCIDVIDSIKYTAVQQITADQFKHAVFNNIDGSITVDQFSSIWRDYYHMIARSSSDLSTLAAVPVVVLWTVASKVPSVVMRAVATADYYLSDLEPHATNLNKLIQEYTE